MLKKVLFEMWAYNSENYIREAIDSLINQTDTSWLLFAIDNGSTDNTGEILEEYAKIDNRIRCVRFSNNYQPTPDEYNYAWREVFFNLCKEVEYQAQLDSDDYYHPKFIEKMYAAAKQHNADMVVCGTSMFSDKDQSLLGNRIPLNVIIENKTMSDEQFINMYGCLRPLWGKLFSIELRLKRNVEYAPFTGEIANGFDTYQVLNMLNKGTKKLVGITEILHYYRVRETSLYHSNITNNRFREGQILYDLGVETAITYNAYTEPVKKYLLCIYYEHIRDIFNVVIRTTKMSIAEKFNVLSYILDDKLAREFSYLDTKKIYVLIRDSILEILNGLTLIEKSILSRYVLVRMFWKPFKDAPALEKAWDYSILYDGSNKLQWGSELLDISLAYDKEEIIKFVNGQTNNELLQAKQKLLLAIDEKRYEEAMQILTFLLSYTPLDIHTLYFGMYLTLTFRKYDLALLISTIAEVFFSDDNDISTMIKNVHKIVKNENKELI